MRIVNIAKEKKVWKTEEELEEERKDNGWHKPYKTIPLKEPSYVVEMTSKELQLVSFYLELERRNPIINMKLDAEIKEE